MRSPAFRHTFVEFIPDDLETGMLYVSLTYATAVHACACGCGDEVVTPISPTDWTLLFDGESVSLDPSIGNWSLPCRSHYWIRQGHIICAPQWSEREIAVGRAHDRQNKRQHFDLAEAPFEGDLNRGCKGSRAKEPRDRAWERLRAFLRW